MLGALEVKAVTRLAAEHAAEWKPVHTAVLDCLLAHRNRHSGHCFPPRRVIAAHANVSERTVDRAIARLVGWGALEKQRPRSASTGQLREAQYSLRFEIPGQISAAVENPCELEEKSCANPASHATNSGATTRQNGPSPRDKIEGLIRKEGKDLRERSEGGNAPLPKNAAVYSQNDFDERDWRKLNHEIGMMRESSMGGGDGEERFKIACQRAGISPRRGYELWERMMA